MKEQNLKFSDRFDRRDTPKLGYGRAPQHAVDDIPRQTRKTARVVTLKAGRVERNRIYITGGEDVGLEVNDHFESVM